MSADGRELRATTSRDIRDCERCEIGRRHIWPRALPCPHDRCGLGTPVVATMSFFPMAAYTAALERPGATRASERVPACVGTLRWLVAVGRSGATNAAELLC